MMTTHVDVQRRIPTSGYIPKRFNTLTRGRFLKARRERELRRIEGEPTAAQVEMARSMALLEWGMHLATHLGTQESLREGRENARLLLRVRGDFERSLEPKTVVGKGKPGPSHATLDEQLALLREREPGE
jgi:hypothetical protein